MDCRSAINSVVNRPYAVMGIINVTPDSFFDGGRYVSADAAFEHGMRLASEGADILDVGGASSRPGAKPVPPEEEAARVLPVLRRLAREYKGIISVDTTRAPLALRALEAGAAWINDISAGKGDPRMAELAARRGCTVVLMHLRGTPATMQTHCCYRNVVAEVKRELLASVRTFIRAGVAGERIVIDPGIGFAKTAEQNVELMRHLDVFVRTGHPVLVGPSRKSFIGHLTGCGPEDRLWGTLGSVGAAFLRGARIFRVHDVAAVKDFLTVLSSIEGRRGGSGRKAATIRRTVRGG
jgi:dihydropteroate synthase